ncbi:hypothetical protein B0T25DRAFT_583235 [Lasiosphaeria hispida]|uniref:Uncharacterized protein n=1 Tax=Lasiosphaeria hispida TaxID=260671 RepID=A0AAJ0HAW6_9PEZI|nr:hypothetical protein B0T25DRAFT_583235 [Lasiosphaeria hispida]
MGMSKMPKDVPPPYSKGSEAIYAKTPWVDRLLGHFGLYRRVPPTESYRKTPSKPLAETKTKLELEPKLEGKRAIKRCGRCKRLFYHPIRASDPSHLRYCGLHHPGQCRDMREMIDESGEGDLVAWALEQHDGIGVWDCCFVEASGQLRLLELVRASVIRDVNEAQSALELSEKMDGHALALSFVAGLINANSWSIHEFAVKFERDKRAVDKLDRLNSLWTLFKVSFASLREPSSTMLGIMAYINPASIPGVIFTRAEIKSLSMCLKRRKNAISILLGDFRRQEALENTVTILFDGFDIFQGQFYDRWKNGQIYIQQITSLKNYFSAERKEKEYEEDDGEEGPVKPTVRFCQLLTNVARYLLETANYTELKDVPPVAGRTFDLPTDVEKKQGGSAYCSTLSNTGPLYAHRGFFDLSLPKIEECYSLRCKM